MNSAIIILAAGASSRLGRPKQLLIYQGKTLIQHVISVAEKSKADEIILVLGSDHELISKETAIGKKTSAIVNDKWKGGMASTITIGLNFLRQNFNADFAIIAVCDQPFIDTALLNELMDKHVETSKPIVACRYENTLGTPVLFHKNLFGQLLTLSGDEGAKKLIMQHVNDVETIPFPLGGIDIDTNEQYTALMQ